MPESIDRFFLQKKEDFPLLQSRKSFLYLDSAATTHKPSFVIDAMSDFYRNSYATVHRGVYSLAREATEAYNHVRCKVQKFLNASSSEEIVFTRGTTDSLNLVAQSFGKTILEEGDCVLIPEIEHHSTIVPWQMVCKERKALLQKIPVNADGEILLDEYEALLKKRAKMVCFAHINNVFGTCQPVKLLVELARKYGAYVCVDGAQSASHKSIDVQYLDVDFFAFSSHKIYGPTGVGILYGKRELLEKMPPVQGGGDMIERVSFEKSTFQSPPLRFEAGTPMIAEVIGLGAAIDYLEEIGFDQISTWENLLLEKLTASFQSIPGVKIHGNSPTKAAIVSFSIDAVHPLDLATFLDLKGIAIRSGHLCSQPSMSRLGLTSIARASLGLYNQLDDIERFSHSLSEVITFLR